MNRFLPMVILAALVWAGCGGKSSTPMTVAVTISPTNPSVAGGATQQFTATVTGSTNTAVTWQVNGEAGGDAKIGTISTTGLYTAPQTLPNPASVTVFAVSQADTTKNAQATVTLTAPPVTITISPTAATLPAGAQQQFTASVTGNSNTSVTWTVNGFAAGNSVVGTVDSTGLYTAPAAPPREAITVTATSQANTAFSAPAPVTVQFGNASLNGHYVFFTSQPDNSSGSGFAFRGGTFVADGKGNISGGLTDSNSSASGPLPNIAISTGSTYSVMPDGRGTATIVDANGSRTFSFALTSSTRGQIIEFDSAGVTSGFIRQQDQTAISSASGPFVFTLAGDNSGPSVAVGQISFSGATISGTEDSSTSGAVTQNTALAGSVTSPPAGGRGTMTINSSQYVFYIVDASTLVLIDVDPAGSARLAGTAYAQSGTFSNASLLSSVFFVNGNAVSGNTPYALAGRFDTNGSGGFSNGIFDVNNGGTIPATSSFASGATYNLTTVGSGRYQLSTGSSNFIVWLASSKLGVVMTADTTPVATATGLLLQQQTGIPSITGGFEFATAGASADGATAQAVDAQITTNGFGVLSGAQDINAGGQTQSAALAGTSHLTIASGTTGRGIASISSLTYGLYLVSADRFVLLSSTPSGPVLSGIAERQCSDCTF